MECDFDKMWHLNVGLGKVLKKFNVWLTTDEAPHFENNVDADCQKWETVQLEIVTYAGQANTLILLSMTGLTVVVEYVMTGLERVILTLKCLGRIRLPM